VIVDLVRDGKAAPNYGQLYVDGVLLGQTLEDTDRHLEDGGEKVYGETAIPRGRYKVVLSYSNRFKRIMPEVLGVRTHTGVRIHGGNDEVDTLGCPLLGRVRTPTGIRDCKIPNDRLIDLLAAAELRGEDVWLVVK
jgi:hypothetical protein